MSVESDLVNLIGGDETVAGLIGDRFYTQAAPEGTAMPCMVYRMTESGGERTLAGHIIGQTYGAQVWLLAETYEEIIQLKAAVGAVSGNGSGDISRIYVNEGPDGYEFEDRLYTKILDVEIVN